MPSDVAYQICSIHRSCIGSNSRMPLSADRVPVQGSIRARASVAPTSSLTLPRLKDGRFFFQPVCLLVFPCEKMSRGNLSRSVHTPNGVQVPVCPTVPSTCSNAFARMFTAALCSLSRTMLQPGHMCVLMILHREYSWQVYGS